MIAHYRNETGGAQIQEILLDDSSEVYIASLSIAEFARRLLSLGIDVAMAREEALNYAGMVARVIPVDTALSIRAFELGSAATSRLPLVDAIIAACALTVDAILVHRDPHFDALPSTYPKRLSLS